MLSIHTGSLSLMLVFMFSSNACGHQVGSIDESSDKILVPQEAKEMTKNAVEKPALLNASLTGGVVLAPKGAKQQAQTITFSLTNQQQHAIALQYNSGMTADLWLLSPDGSRLWAWSDEMMFTQAIRDVTMASGETITVKFQLPPHALAMIKGPEYKLKALLKAKAMDDSKLRLVNEAYYLIP